MEKVQIARDETPSDSFSGLVICITLLHIVIIDHLRWKGMWELFYT
jgi:hypothetical protein